MSNAEFIQTKRVLTKKVLWLNRCMLGIVFNRSYVHKLFTIYLVNRDHLYYDFLVCQIVLSISSIWNSSFYIIYNHNHLAAICVPLPSILFLNSNALIWLLPIILVMCAANLVRPFPIFCLQEPRFLIPFALTEFSRSRSSGLIHSANGRDETQPRIFSVNYHRSH